MTEKVYSIPDLAEMFGKTEQAVRLWRRRNGRNGVKLEVRLCDSGIRVTQEQLKKFLNHNEDLYESSDAAKKLREELNLLPAASPELNLTSSNNESMTNELKIANLKDNESYPYSNDPLSLAIIQLQRDLKSNKERRTRLLNELLELDREIEYQESLILKI